MKKYITYLIVVTILSLGIIALLINAILTNNMTNNPGGLWMITIVFTVILLVLISELGRTCKQRKKDKPFDNMFNN